MLGDAQRSFPSAIKIMVVLLLRCEVQSVRARDESAPQISAKTLLCSLMHSKNRAPEHRGKRSEPAHASCCTPAGAEKNPLSRKDMQPAQQPVTAGCLTEKRQGLALFVSPPSL